MITEGKGAITLALRERSGLGAGVDVDVVANDAGALVRQADTSNRGIERVAQLRDRADGGLDAESVLRLTRSDEPA